MVLRWLLDGLLEGFGLVAAGIIGAGVAVGFSTPGLTSGWYVLGIMGVAVFLASNMAILRGVIMEMSARGAASSADAHEGDAEAVAELASEVRALRAEIVRLQQPWWKRRRHAR